jgi:hypothetical protein
LRPFLHDLFLYEAHWSTSLDKDEVEALGRPPDGVEVRPVRLRPATKSQAIGPIWKIYLALREMDSSFRTLAESGPPSEVERVQEDIGSLPYLMNRLPPDLRSVTDTGCSTVKECVWPWQYDRPDWSARRRPALFGQEDWMSLSIQRALRRALDIEKLDDLAFEKYEQAHPGDAAPRPSNVPRWIFPMAEILSASFIERGTARLDWGSGTVFRLADDHHWFERGLFGVVVPQYLSKELLGCGADVGWDLRVRSPGTGFFFGFNLALQGNFCAPSGTPWFGGRLAPGVGYDPRGRIVDDVQANLLLHWVPVLSGNAGALPGEVWGGTSVGLEASFTLVTKVRLGIGWRDLQEREPRPGTSPTGFEQLVGRFNSPYVTVGLTDLNALGWVLWEVLRAPEAEAQR